MISCSPGSSQWCLFPGFCAGVRGTTENSPRGREEGGRRCPFPSCISLLCFSPSSFSFQGGRPALLGKARLVGFRGDGERVAPQVGPDATGVRIKRKGGERERESGKKVSDLFRGFYANITRGVKSAHIAAVKKKTIVKNGRGDEVLFSCFESQFIRSLRRTRKRKRESALPPPSFDLEERGGKAEAAFIFPRAGQRKKPFQGNRR